MSPFPRNFNQDNLFLHPPGALIPAGNRNYYYFDIEPGTAVC